MGEKKFEITYSDEAKKVVKPLLNCVRVSDLIDTDGGALDEFFSTVRKVGAIAAEKFDAEIFGIIADIAKERGLSDVIVLDKEVTAAKLMRLEPKEIIVHGYRPGRAVNSLSYTCPTCGAHIGRYPFCKYCGQALKIEN